MPQRALILHGEGLGCATHRYRKEVTLLSELIVYVRFTGIRRPQEKRTELLFPCKARRAEVVLLVIFLAATKRALLSVFLAQTS